MWTTSGSSVPSPPSGLKSSSETTALGHRLLLPALVGLQLLEVSSPLGKRERSGKYIVMRADVMNSEESDSGTDSDDQSMFIKYPLPWQRDKVNSLGSIIN